MSQIYTAESKKQLNDFMKLHDLKKFRDFKSRNCRVLALPVSERLHQGRYLYASFHNEKYKGLFQLDTFNCSLNAVDRINVSQETIWQFDVSCSNERLIILQSHNDRSVIIYDWLGGDNKITAHQLEIPIVVDVALKCSKKGCEIKAFDIDGHSYVYELVSEDKVLNFVRTSREG